MRKKISIDNIRRDFLNFFYNKGHKIVPSSSLIPKNDNSLLFTNSGMNQFKNIFLGLEEKKFNRVVTAQRCVRAGGKHNDLENVGYSDRHHTFFEMLGNFSFGDYFKEKAILYAWEFLTDKNYLNLDKNRIFVTVYENDHETYDIWKNKVGFLKERILKIGNKKNSLFDSDNFWKMGETGPCGPCTEIFYSYVDINGIDLSEININHSIEIWNIVFIEYNCDIKGNLKKLKKTSVDTGMGLERITSVLQGVKSNYEIDLFLNLISCISKIINVENKNNNSLRVIADHIRSSIFLIFDGVLPSNEGRGYVLRRIIRRAICHAYLLNYRCLFLSNLVEPVIKIIGNNIKNIELKKRIIKKVLKKEEIQFSVTLKKGLNILEKEFNKIDNNILSGSVVFKLYDTHGVQLDLIYDICKSKNIKIDQISFEKEMKNQKKRSKKNSKFKKISSINFEINGSSFFLGYNKKNSVGKVIKIIYKNNSVSKLAENQEGIVFLNKTTFYPESGGQIGDTGVLINDSSKFLVYNTRYYGQCIGHIGKLEKGFILIQDAIESKIDYIRRKAISLNHTGLHLLNSALRIVLGDYVQQKGSMINEKYLSLDFNYNKKIKKEYLYSIEKLVNNQIIKNSKIVICKNKLNNNKKNNYFNKKNKSRMLIINDFSTEFCCGTHANRTGELGFFIIKKECNISSGIRRIQALTGFNSFYHIKKNFEYLFNIKKILKCKNSDLVENIQCLSDKFKFIHKSLYNFKKNKIINECLNLIKKTKKIKYVNFLFEFFNKFEKKELIIVTNYLKNKLKFGIIIIFNAREKRNNIIVTITNDLIEKINFYNFINFFRKQVDGKVKFYKNLAIISNLNKDLIYNNLIKIKKWITLNLD